MEHCWNPPSLKEWLKRLPEWWPVSQRCTDGRLPEWIEELLDEHGGAVCIEGWCIKREGDKTCIYPWPRQFRLDLGL